MRKLNWFAYINKQRHENKILNELEATYGKDAVMIVGDWGGNQKCIKRISSPGIGFKRMLDKRFTVILIDEYKSSIINCHTHEENLGNLIVKVKTKSGKMKKVSLYSVLTYQMGNKRIGCINRDNNAKQNLLDIVHALLETGERPQVFQRKKPRLTNPIITVM